MNYYFMVMIDGLEGVVTLANFPPKDKQVPWPPKQIAYVLWSDGKNWQFRVLDHLEPGALKSFKSSELPDDYPGDVTPFFCLSPEKFPSQIRELPENNLMETTPAWRANIQIMSPHTSVSYQGEYPQAMLSISKGSILSLGTLLQSGQGISNKFIFPNLHKSPRISSYKLSFLKMRSQEIIMTACVRSNDSSVIDLGHLDVSDKEPIVVTAIGTSGIPIFFSHDKDFKYMSFEHTHPPMEMLFLGQRYKHQRNMKNWWLKKGLKT